MLQSDGPETYTQVAAAIIVITCEANEWLLELRRHGKTCVMMSR